MINTRRAVVSSWFARTARHFSLALLVLAPTVLPACASSQPAASHPPQQGPKKAENLKDVEDNLRQFRDEVKAFAASAADPSSVEDPHSLRGQERAGEQRLSQEAAELRRRIRAFFGAAPAPGPADKEREKQMLQDLDESEKKLDQARRNQVRP